MGDPKRRAIYDQHGFARLARRPMTDFRSAAFRDLFDSCFDSDPLGMPVHA